MDGLPYYLKMMKLNTCLNVPALKEISSSNNNTKEQRSSAYKTPKSGENVYLQDHIPCYFVDAECKDGPTKVLIYFHGNNEDIGNENEAISNL